MTDLITDQIVETAARAMHEWSTGSQPRSLAFNPAWDDATHDSKRYWLDVARTTLEAAAPLIEAQGLEAAADAWQRGEWANAPRYADPVKERIANGQYVGTWLRDRAVRQAATTKELRIRTVVAGVVGGVAGNLAVTFALRGIWWPLVLVGVAFAVLMHLARRNDREILRLLAERRDAGKEPS